MKRALVLILVLGVLFSVAGCGKEDPRKTELALQTAVVQTVSAHKTETTASSAPKVTVSAADAIKTSVAATITAMVPPSTPTSLSTATVQPTATKVPPTATITPTNTITPTVTSAPTITPTVKPTAEATKVVTPTTETKTVATKAPTVGSEQKQPTSKPTAVAKVTARPTVKQGKDPSQWGKKYATDFSRVGDFPNVQGGTGYYRDVLGTYYYVKPSPGGDIAMAGLQGKKYSDLLIQANGAMVEEGSEGVTYGIFLRSDANRDNFYAFVVRSSGEYAVKKYSSNGPNSGEMLDSGWSENINTLPGRDGLNELTVLANGRELVFWCNGEELSTVTDEEISFSGYVGMIAWNMGRGVGGSAGFTDFTVYAP